jgi:hypothetical protein
MKNSQNVLHTFEVQLYVKQIGMYFIEEFAFREDHITKPRYNVK